VRPRPRSKHRPCTDFDAALPSLCCAVERILSPWVGWWGMGVFPYWPVIWNNPKTTWATFTPSTHRPISCSSQQAR